MPRWRKAADPGIDELLGEPGGGRGFGAGPTIDDDALDDLAALRGGSSGSFGGVPHHVSPTREHAQNSRPLCALRSMTVRPRNSPLRMRGASSGNSASGTVSVIRSSVRAADRGQPPPGLDAQLERAHHRIDAEQIDAAQQERDHRRRQVAAAGEAAGRDAGAIFELRQDRRQGGAADRVDRAGPALAVERPRRRLRQLGALDELGGAEPFR